MNRLMAGVIGVGHLGRHHARILASHHSVNLAAVADADSSRAREIAQEYGAESFQDYHLLLPLVQAVIIATPTTSHFPIARDCLQAGKHVLLEKPIAQTLEEADILIGLAQSAGCCFQIGHSERFNPAIRQARSLIQNPRFVEIHRIGPFAGRGTDVDVVLDLMIHDLDLLIDWVNSPVTAVDAVGVPVLSSTVDIANARIKFACGAVANLTASRASLEPLRKIRIFGANSYISIDARAQEVLIVRRDLEAAVARDNPMAGIVPQQLAVDKGEPLKGEIYAFINSILGGLPPEVGGADARRALALAQQIKTLI